MALPALNGGAAAAGNIEQSEREKDTERFFLKK
jgi:hypothetical protein